MCGTEYCQCLQRYSKSIQDFTRTIFLSGQLEREILKSHQVGRFMKIVVVIQARTESTRLPGKVLLPLSGQPVLQRLVERIRAAKTKFDLVVATTDRPQDDVIVELCRRSDWKWYRGSSDDLLDRHHRVA